MKRVLGERAESGVNFHEKLVTESRLTALVPIEGFRHLGLRLGPDDEAVTHFRRDVMRL